MQVPEILRKLTTPSRNRNLDVVLLHVDSYYNLAHSQPNLGLLSIATLLQESGFRVRLLTPKDLFRMTREDLHAFFIQATPRLVGFYTMSDTIFQVANLADRISGWLPDARRVAGGPLASGLGADLDRYHAFDFVVKGEGERPMLALAQAFCRGAGDPSTIPGVLIRQEGRLVAGPPPEPVQDLDSLPDPDRNLVDNPLRFHVSTGRGCPYACTFCFQAVHGRGYRYRSARRVADEVIRNLEAHNHRAFDIIDDTFVANPARVLEFCEILRDYRSRTGRDFVWYCEARVDILGLRPELLQAMKEVGLVRLQIGIESGDPETLKHYEKRLRPGQIEELCRRIAEVDDISMYGNFIMGGPFETRQTWANSLKLARRLLRLAPGLFETTASFLTPFPETPIANHPERYGLQVEDREFLTSLTLEECTCRTEELSCPDVRRMRHEFMARLGREMRALVPRIPRRRILSHFRWANRYGTVTRWYRHIFSELAAMREYFAFYDHPKFRALDEIPRGELLEWTPLRTIGPLQYDPRNWEDFLLRASYRPLRLTDPIEKEVYALSVGKLNLGGLVQALQQRTGLPGDLSSVLEQRVLPALRRLEDHYQVIFHN